MLRPLWLPSLVVGAIEVTDERRHRPGPESRWAESWYFDFTASDGSVAGYVRLALYPNLGIAWYWAALVGDGRRLVMVNDRDLDVPRGRDLEVRGQGIWSAITCETPLDHWSVGLEAFALGLDDPMEALASERGDLVGLAYDLEWEATATATASNNNGYRQPCRVSGEILVGDEQLAFDGPGEREHRWGVEDWWSSPKRGEVAPPNGDLRHHAPLLLKGPDGNETRLMRALTSRPSGGYRWAEWIDAPTF